jgi:hypothetical protein
VRVFSLWYLHQSFDQSMLLQKLAEATSMPCAVFATGQPKDVVVTGDPSVKKGTRLAAAVQN